MSEPRDVWDSIAQWWSQESEKGDPFHTFLIHPFLEKLLPLKSGDKMLDLACGNGFLSRRFASKGVEVTGVDFSKNLLEIARRNTPPELPINYLELDLCNEESLDMLGEMRFDSALCSMALHNLQTITPLMKILRKILSPSGRFVCSIPHPCFNSSPGLSVIREDDFYPPDIRTSHSVRLKDYLSRQEFYLSAKKGQPMPHFNVHLALQDLLSVCFDAGFRMTNLYEPSGALMPEHIDSTWRTLQEIPPVMIISFELAKPLNLDNSS